ncbi:peptidoglycan DD-metalloendopeptidase family protein [soil metagenome]
MALLAVVLVLAGCNSAPRRAAPVEDRVAGVNNPLSGAIPPLPGTAPTEEAKLLPGAENAGKPGYYTVKPGDTLIRIGLDSGQNWKDIVRWNNMENANLIEVGQVLRVVPPGSDPNAVATRGVASTRVETRPLDARGLPIGPAVPASGAPLGGPALPPPTTAPATPPVAVAPVAPPAAAAAEKREGDEDVNWMWPANGPVVATYDEVKSKGLSIAGKAGDPVTAAADGRVVYAGSGLRGYGNLVIIKHNNTYLTAYAHNQTLSVKEDQTVRRGQKIAEMGSSDSDRVKLHFEIRKLGKPIDPARLLPPR